MERCSPSESRGAQLGRGVCGGAGTVSSSPKKESTIKRGFISVSLHRRARAFKMCLKALNDQAWPKRMVCPMTAMALQEAKNRHDLCVQKGLLGSVLHFESGEMFPYSLLA